MKDLGDIMAYKWDLSKIYPKKEDFYFDMTLIRDKIKKLDEHREFKVDGNSLYDLMKECFLIREMNSKTLLYASLNYYTDINNKNYITMKQQAEELDIFVSNETNFIDELINIIDEDKLKEFYEECPNLGKYIYYINNTKRLGKHIINDNYNELNNSIMENSKCLVEYNKLLSSMEFGMVDDVFLNNSNVSNYLVDRRRNIRKKIFNTLNESYLKLGDKYFDIFSKLVNNKKNIAICNKYNSVLESELFNEGIEEKLIINLINSVNKNISLMNKYLSFKMRYLKIDNPKLYDINIPIVNNKDSYGIERALVIIKNSLLILGKNYVRAIDKLINDCHLDLDVNDKKHPNITFSWNTYTFMNYKDRYIDLKNLAHELGHIINSYYSLEKQPFIYSDSTVFISEVMSLVNEILLNEYLYLNAVTKEEKIFYLTKNIENFIGQVFRQTMYTEFENIVYNSKLLTLNELNNSYLELINKYYGKVISIDDDIKCEWMRVGHLYRWNYYVYKYAFGYILAFNVVKKIKKDNPDYIDFIASGDSCSNVDMLKKLGIDLYDEKLIDNSFELLEEYISLLNKISEEN